MKMKSVSLVLPMFNEMDYIKKAVSRAVSVLEPITTDFEIIIVDDASNDGSEEIADRLSGNDNRIKVIHHKKNRKLGGVLKSGFALASKEIVIYTDIDMPFDYSLLEKFIALMDGADIINGYRADYRESFKRIIYSKVYNILIKAIFGLKVKDVNFSMKIFKKRVIDSINLKSEGSFINAEALAKAQYLMYKIKEVPVVYFPRQWGSSRLSAIPVIIKIIYEMIKFFPEIMSLRVKMSYLYCRANLHNFMRLRTCPYKSIEKFIPQEGDIYDLGCGYGTFVNFLGLFASGKRKIIGFDIDALKVRFASILHKDNGVDFKVRDINEDLKIINAACIVMIDVLVLMPFAQQERLLNRCFNYLSETGVLIIKEIDTRPFWKYGWHQFQATLVLKVFKLIQGEGLYCRPRQSYIGLFKKIGYKVDVLDIQKGYLYPHMLYICSKN